MPIFFHYFFLPGVFFSCVIMIIVRCGVCMMRFIDRMTIIKVSYDLNAWTRHRKRTVFLCRYYYCDNKYCWLRLVLLQLWLGSGAQLELADMYSNFRCFIEYIGKKEFFFFTLFQLFLFLMLFFFCYIITYIRICLAPLTDRLYQNISTRIRKRETRVII